ncbi:DUF6160 family protein [Acinetobacter bouvetii]|uniref:DUF6160 domain-containing protein n=1 Tax=Acinetobacter bouvetii TaxID=202951 RepID=A0A811GEG8_9GAMM|nr:DUF6160 family protein [Acinetobacter bouvetii]CAB1216198.1 hypothetical protein SFB21_1912 [Acinetobacter bouvetii]
MKIIKLNILTACVLVAQYGYAIQELTDQTLSHVTGQDGITITHEISKATINQANWVDYTNTGNMKLGLSDVVVTGNGQTNIMSQLDFDVGATTNGAGVKIRASVSPFQATVKDIMLICDSCTTDKKQSLGSLGIKTTTPFVINLETTNGLFNRDAKAHLDLNLQNASISYGLNNHNLTLKDFNFNLSADGYMYLQQGEGIVLTTKSKDGTENHLVDLGRVTDTSDTSSTRTGTNAATNPGVNIDLRYGSGTTQNNLIRMGASGAITNGTIFINSDQSGYQDFRRTTNGTLSANTTDYQSLGVGGLHFGMSGEFTRAGNSLLGTTHAPTTLEIGHTGHGSNALEFSNLSPLAIRTSNTDVNALNKQNAYIDFGDIYINTVRTNNLSFIYNDNIEKILGKNATESNQISYQINPNNATQNAALIAVRGFDFQSIARTAKFISDNSIAKLENQTATWGIGIPIYNMNANLALFAKGYRRGTATTDSNGLGYNLVFSTDGYGIDQKTGKPATTSIIIVDGGVGTYGEAVNYYAGLRNIDSYMKSDGVIGFEDDGIYIKADHLLFAAKAEIAIGQLPGSLYNCPDNDASCTASTTAKIVPIDNFAKKDDVLSSIAFKLDGKGELLIIPGVESSSATPDSNFLSMKADFTFNDPADTGGNGSYISIINEDTNKTTGAVTESSVNLNKLQGHIGLESRIKVKSDTVVMDNQLKFNYENATTKVLKAELALSPSAGNMQKIADIAITGGTMRSTLGITPR